MKKSKIIALTSAVSITAAAVFAATSIASAAPALGDVDNDERVTAKDARMILRHAAKLEMLDNSLLPVADANGDGNVTVADARLVLRYASKLITEMGGEKKYNDDLINPSGSDETAAATTKKTDSSDLSTQPATRPTTTKVSETTTAGGSVTQATTEATTKKTSGETTTAEATTKADESNSIPAAIRTFTSGKYDFSGTVLSADGKQDVRFTVDGKNLRISMSVDGLNLDFMRLVETSKITKKDKSDYYIISVDNNSYIDFSETAMKLVGIDESQLELPEMSVDISNATYTTSITTFNEKENVMCYTFKSDNSFIKFYMDGDNLLGMETCDSSENIITAIVFDSFSGEIPEGRLSVDGLKKMTLIDFAKLFTANN